MKKIIKYVITFVILIFTFNLLLLLGSLFPSSWIEDHVRESSERLSLEGNLPLFTSYLSITNNNYTDSIMINECYSIDNTNPFFSYLSARKNFKKELTEKQLEDTNGELISISSNSTEEIYNPVEELSEFLEGKVDTSIEYARYWHGYLPFLRILLIFFNITEIRLLLLVLFFILFIVLIVLLKKKLGNMISFIFAFSLLAYDYFFISYSLESSPIFLTMMISCIILLIFIDKIKNIYLYLFIMACISNFVDFLTVPLITLASPLYIYILYKQKQEHLDIKKAIKIIIGSCIAWGCGYALTWFSKWVIYDIFYNKNLISSAISQVLYRTTSTNYLTSRTILGVLVNFLCNHIIFVMLFIWVSSIILLLLYRKYSIHLQAKSFFDYLKRIVPILFISILPIIWYIVLTNHTILHIHFVYRHMLILLTGNLICFQKVFTIEKK